MESWDDDEQLERSRKRDERKHSHKRSHRQRTHKDDFWDEVR